MNNLRITAKPRTLKELAAYYGVSYQTFKKWLTCESLKTIIPEKGYYFSVKQVKIIIDHLGVNDE